MPDQPSNTLPSNQIVPLLETLSTWKNTTTIIIHEACVFEFKGVFPPGSIAQGYYNLNSQGIGFEGHLKLDALCDVYFQRGQHRGKSSYAFVFRNSEQKAIFKVFLGRDSAGELHQEQIEKFEQFALNLSITP